MNPIPEEQEMKGFVLGVLLRKDPLNVNYGGAREVYAPDADAIVSRLEGCHTEQELCAVVHQQMQRSFGPEAAGPFERYLPIAREIWGFCHPASSVGVGIG